MSIELIHGDCLEVMPELDCKVDLVLADPPYGITNCKWDLVLPFDELWGLFWSICDGAVCLFGSEPFSSALRMSQIKYFKYDWVWQKEDGTGFLNCKKMPLKDFELISLFYKKPVLYNPQMRQGFKPYSSSNKPNKQKGTTGDYKSVRTENNGDRYPVMTLSFNRQKKTVHPTQKPVALLEYLIKTYTNEGDTILDFCMGSGSTGVACQNTNRNFIGIEKDKSYYDIAVERNDYERKTI